MRLIMGLILSLCLVTGAFAQDPLDAPDYVDWDAKAQIFENAVSADDTRSEILIQQRAQVAEFRDRFQAAQSVNTDRIDTVKSQIDALGPLPADGTVEVAAVADRRAALTQQLSELRAPRIRAEEAFARADGIIEEIDATLNKRQVTRVLRRNPSPLVPANLWAGWSEFWGIVSQTSVEMVRGWSQIVGTAGVVMFWILIAGLVAILALFAFGRGHIKHLVVKLLNFAPSHYADRTAKLMVTTGFALALVAVLVWMNALLQPVSHIGPDARVIQGMLMGIFMGVGIVFWIAAQYEFVADGQISQNVLRRKFLASITVLSGLTVAYVLFDAIVGRGVVSPTAVAVGHGLYVLLSAPFVYRLGRALLYAAKTDPAWENRRDPDFGTVKFWLGYILKLVSVVAPIAALIGFSILAVSLMFASSLTFVLVLVAFTLSRGLRDALSAKFGAEAAETNGLIPILWNMVLICAALPALALIWGARVSDISELWQSIKTGVKLGDTTISPMVLLTLFAVFILGYLVTRLLKKSLQDSILPRTKIEAGAQNALVAGVGYIGMFLAALIALTAAGINLSSLAIVAGALSIGVGFGLQNIVSNFVSGIILLIERPIRVGDWIEVGGLHGTVREISVRSTRIEAFDSSDLIIPNADLVSGTVTNYTRGNTVGRVIVPIGVAYGTDTRQVEQLLLDIAKQQPMVSLNPPPSVVFQGFGADSMDFELRCILRDINWGLSVRSEINHQIAEQFAQNGIEIPFAQREITIKNLSEIKS